MPSTEAAPGNQLDSCWRDVRPEATVRIDRPSPSPTHPTRIAGAIPRNRWRDAVGVVVISGSACDPLVSR